MSDSDQLKPDPIRTDFVLVIKGAGEHAVDATLDIFLNGFLPAVRQHNPLAKVRVGRESTVLADYNYQPFFKEHDQKVAEVMTLDSKGEPRRIWVKEAYWEPFIQERGPLKALFSEWGLTSYSLRKVIEDLFFPWHKGLRYAKNGTPTRSLNAAKFTVPGYLLFFSLAYLLVFAFLGLTDLWAHTPLASGLEISRKVTGGLAGKLPFWAYLLGMVVFALAVALGPAVQSARRHRAKQRMPRLGSWLMAALVAALLLQPGGYTVLLLLLFLCGVIPIVLARRLAWSRRPTWYTDAPVTYYFDPDQKYIDQRLSRLARGTQLVYRFFAVMAVPVAMAALVLVKGFRILDLFGDQGKKIDDTLSRYINRTLGDVTAYALDPVQAAVVQNVVEEDIQTFASLTSKADPDQQVVTWIHLIAHSQGTPITYEVYFHLLDREPRRKVRNLLTIGSVLNLHNEVNEVLDESYWRRFPPVEYPAYSEINRGFKWFNFWNFTDPITQFTGLEAYRYASLKLDKDQQVEKYADGTPKKTFHKASPFSLKTRESILKNHSEYWTNIEEIHLPFIKHILNRDSSIWLPDEWLSPSLRRRQRDDTWDEDEHDPSSYERKKSNHRLLFVGIWLVLLAASLALGTTVWLSIVDWVLAGITAIGGVIDSLLNWLAGLFTGGAADFEGPFWKTVANVYKDQRLVNGIGLALLVWGVLNSLGGLIPQREQHPDHS